MAKSIKHKGLMLIATLLLVILSSGCMSSEEKEVRQVVTKYNNNLILALRRPQPEMMTNLTTKREATRISSYILYFAQQNKLLDSKLLELRFEQVQITKNKATVKTRERWSYQHLDFKTKKVVKPPIFINYQATYLMEKQKEKWVVASLEVTDDHKKP